MKRWVNVVLLAAIVVDSVLPLMALFAPQLWFQILHGTADQPEQHAFLLRCAAHWVAFLIVQLVALPLWRKRPEMLLIVAGARFSDVLTDVTYLVSSSTSPLGTALLMSPPFFNAGMAAVLLLAYRER